MRVLPVPIALPGLSSTPHLGLETGNGFHGTSEVTDDPTKIHGREATTLARPRLLNPRIKSQARLCSELSGSVRSFGLSWLIRAVRYMQIQRKQRRCCLQALPMG